MPDWVFGGWFKLILVVVGLVVIAASLKFNVWYSRQKAVNELSEMLSTAINQLLSRQISNDMELGQLKSDISSWCDEILAKIDQYPTYFSKSDRIHFDRLGAVPENDWGIAYKADNDDTRHRHQLNMLSLKFDRLRDIINWTQQRTR